MASREYKYVKHSDKQRSMILEKARILFQEYGIKDVSMSRIAQESGIMRATLYRYFENKDAVVWEIYIMFNQNVVEKMRQKTEGKVLSTYEKTAIFLRNMVDVFREMPEYFEFFFHFSREYLNNRLYPDTSFTRELYETTGITSGSTVAFLTEHFHDGSVKEELESQSTGVSIVYGSLGTIQIISSNRDSIPLKYGITAEQVLVNSFRNMLVSLKKEGYSSELADHIWE